jgi:hypothetical protein
MASQNETINSNLKATDSNRMQSSHVRFDLNESHNGDEIDESSNEVDEFLEFSTLSNNLSSSSFDSSVNGNNSQLRMSSSSDTNRENKSASKASSR